MEKEIVINCKNINQKIRVAKGCSLQEILKQINLKTEYPVVVAKVNNKTESLDYQIYRNKSVDFKALNTNSAWRAYVRSLCFILSKAIDKTLPGAQLHIEHSISNGYFCKIETEQNIDQRVIDSIKKEMRGYIEQDIPFTHTELETDEVIEIFRKQGFEDKVLLLQTAGNLYSKFYELDGYYDYFFSSLVPSTGFINVFDLISYQDGLILLVPNKANPTLLEPFVEQPKLYRAYKKQLDFLRVLGIGNVGDLNLAISNNKYSSIIKVAEAMQEQQIGKIASRIANKANENDVRVVMIAGPSSSGKTTFRMRLEVQMMVNFIRPVGLSLDDYFVNRVDTPRDETGDYDYESLYALDLEQFNKDLLALLEGERVQLPTYNFKTGEREYKEGHELQLYKGDVLVIEGIHGLNPELTASIDQNQIFKVYISALTTISMDNHNWISTSDNRLLRRIIRDYKYRNYSAIDTISRWRKVRDGENKWIFPYQENADMMFNSAMIYELAAIRRYAEPILKQVPNRAPEYAEAYRLLNFLSYFNYVNDNELPPTSLLREFLGGSSFNY